VASKSDLPEFEALLTARQVAELLGVSVGSLLRWARAGQVPATKLPSGAVRFRPEEIDRWLETRAMAGDGTEEVSPAPDATRQREVSSLASPVPLRPVAARTEEEHDGRP
jgi:excisionase family DNA binding protein